MQRSAQDPTTCIVRLDAIRASSFLPLCAVSSPLVCHKSVADFHQYYQFIVYAYIPYESRIGFRTAGKRKTHRPGLGDASRRCALCGRSDRDELLGNGVPVDDIPTGALTVRGDLPGA